jgi:hypothetical protein
LTVHSKEKTDELRAELTTNRKKGKKLNAEGTEAEAQRSQRNRKRGDR